MNEKLKTLIVDDEPMARSFLASLFAPHAGVEVVGMVGSVAEAQDFLKQETPDLVLLDMEMPGEPGLNLQHDLPPGTLTIFVTAFADYAHRAFDFGARDYLLKPVDPLRLALALERLETPYPGRMAEAADDDIECVVEEGKITRVSLDRILWVEAAQNYTQVRLTGVDSAQLVARTMAEWEAVLPTQRFERLSRSIIVNLPRIQTVRWFSRAESLVDFTDCAQPLTLGRTAAMRLKARLKNLPPP
ncbi:MAG: LytTR family DNA-binding domain-containing protein [Akkermansiaceae bacterium]